MKQNDNVTSNLIQKLATDKYMLYTDVNLELPQKGIVFLGDSLVQNFPITEMYNGKLKIYNRGIFGSTTYDIKKYLDSLVNILNPAKVIIWLGTNDFMPFVSNNSEYEIATRIIEIADSIKSQTDCLEIIIMSLLPINHSSNPKIYHNWLIGKDNEKIKTTNTYIEQLCCLKNYNYLSLYDLFLDEAKQLSLNLTIDGIHINYEGYKIIYHKLEKFLN